MQEEGRFVEQSLGGFDALDHNAACHRVQAGVFFRAQLPTGKYDDRHFRQRLIGAQLLEDFESGHVGQSQIQNHAVSRLPTQSGERISSGTGGFNLDVVVAKQFRDTEQLGRIILDHKQTFAPRSRIFLDASERGLNAFRRRRLGDERECAAREAMVLVLVERDDLYGDMTRQRILFELAQDAPTQHVGQKNVKRDRTGLILLGKLECVGAAHCYEHLEPLVPREIDQDAAVVRIVLDDQQY